MNDTASVFDRLSGIPALFRPWLARVSWLLIALASVVLFVRGIPIFAANLQEQYGSNLGLSFQRNASGDIFLIPEFNKQAAEMGVMERDVLVSVNGEPVTAGTNPTTAELIPAGAAGTAVTLQIRTGTGPLREITLIRGGEHGQTLARYGLPVSAVVAFAIGVETVVALGFMGVAGFIFWRRGQDWLVWLASLILIVVFVGPASLPAQQLHAAQQYWQYWLDVWISLALGGLLLFLFLFPTGRFVPRWTAVVMLVWFIWAVAAWFWPTLYFWLLEPVATALGATIWLGVGVMAQVWRYRYVSTARQRQQTKWIVWGIGVAGTAIIVQLTVERFLPSSPLLFDLLINPLTRLSQLLIPVAFAFAIFQRRLWEIDIIFNRTLVYGGWTALITAVYVLLVGGMGTLAINQSGPIISFVVATVVVMWGIRPLRRRWQTAVNHIIPLPAAPLRQTTTLTPERQNGETTVRPWYTPLAAILFLLVLGCIAGFIFLNVSVCRTYSPLNIYWLQGLIGPVGGLAFAIVGLIILYKHPANRIGWLCLLGGLGLSLSVLEYYINCALAGQIALPGLALAAWFYYTILPLLTLLPIFIFLPIWFPNGRFLTPRWRWFALVTVAFMFILSSGAAVTPDFRQMNSVGVTLPLDNPLGLAWLPSWWGSFFGPALNLLMIFGSLAAITSMLLRLKRAVGEERQQMKLFAYWATAAIIQLIVFELIFFSLAPLLEGTVWYDRILSAYNLILLLVFLGFPLITGVAIFKYRLYDIDIIINRTLVYGGLSLGVVTIYVLVVGTLGTLFRSQGNFLFALLATGLIAVLFQPVRERLQRGVNRLMFGERDDPYAVLSKLGTQLQTTATPEATLQSIVQTIAATLKLPFVAIKLADEQGPLGGAVTGKAVAETTNLPLRYQNETVGELVVSSRSPGEAFTEREQRLLADLAAQTGAMAYSVRLTAALQRSREKLVLAREEERRRIRRDLHDGLGPTLASQTFAFDAILELLETDPPEAARLLRGLKAQNQETVAEIRRLVYELRPPALDELGLLGALQAHVAQLNGRSTLPIHINTNPDPLPPLSAAVEVAAYRIALEAITNVVRHAQAQRCEVRVQVVTNGRSHLELTIRDDGVGLPPNPQPGVGLHSMRERCEELGGALTMANQEKGTQVTAVLPLSRPNETGTR